MNGREDRLYELLPAVYRQRDAELGEPLRSLLQVIAGQVNVVEDDIARLYENWFIETCQDWVVPYLGDLIGYRPVPDAGSPGEPDLNRALIPRREVANTLRYRRRKGTLALLELLARDVAGWHARAVEFYRLLGFTQPLNHLRLDRGRTADLRQGVALTRLGGPFTGPAYTVNVGRHPGLLGVGLFVWRLRPYPVTKTPAYLVEEVAPNCYTFSVLGNDAPLFTKPEPESEPTHIAEELNLPLPIERRAFEKHKEKYYGPGKSLQIFRVRLEKLKEDPKRNREVLEPVPLEEIVAADLTDWQYQPKKGEVAVDPKLGRIAFPPRHLPKNGIRVSYHYGFSADIGGGEYDRPISQPAGAVVYQVGEDRKMVSIREALDLRNQEQPCHAVIEITDSRAYVEPVNIRLEKGQTLQLRAARRARPVIRLLDWQTSLPDSLTVEGDAGSAFTLDGLLVTGRSMQVRGDIDAVTLRHSTLVPGWGLYNDCKPRRPAEPSLELINVKARVVIERCILGSIQVSQDEVGTDPVPIRISDSVVDATSREREAVGGPGQAPAHALLTVQRSTVFGQVLAHAMKLGENSIFEGLIRVARRQIGCLRFSSYLQGSRTPRRFNCQPDLSGEPERVRPRFRSIRYGSPVYARLTDGTAEEIRRGADDQSEMGVFHHLYEPQRAANLRARLAEYTPAGADADVIFADQEAP